MTGTIFGIQHFSVQDGAGIRTNIFLSGCPLKCIWCHNPEGISKTPLLSFVADKCVDCGACFTVCPTVHIRENNEHKLKRENCKRCFDCVKTCTVNALEQVGYKTTVDEIMDAVLRDKRYYDSSGGGVTLSGGEPMVQFEFAEAILKECKAKNINTAMETCGYASKEHFRQILPLIDTFLFDIKESDPVLHKKFTGKDNELIFDNLEFLLSNDANIILRYPVIPGLNDRAENLDFITGLTVKHPGISGIELMPYHKLGTSKAMRTGLTEQTVYNVPTDEMKEDMVKKIESAGGRMMKY